MKEDNDMYRPLPTIHDDLEALRTRLRQTGDAEQKQRLHLLVLIDEGRVKSRREAADHLAVHRNSVGRWLKYYECEGLEMLLRVGAGGCARGTAHVVGSRFCRAAVEPAAGDVCWLELPRLDSSPGV